MAGAEAGEVAAACGAAAWLCGFAAEGAWPNADAAKMASVPAIARYKDAFFTSDSSVASDGDMFSADSSRFV